MADIPENVIPFVKVAKELHPSSTTDTEMVDAKSVDPDCFIVMPRAMWERDFVNFRDVSSNVPHVLMASSRGHMKAVPVVFKEALEFEPIFTS